MSDEQLQRPHRLAGGGDAQAARALGVEARRRGDLARWAEALILEPDPDEAPWTALIDLLSSLGLARDRRPGPRLTHSTSRLGLARDRRPGPRLTHSTSSLGLARDRCSGASTHGVWRPREARGRGAARS